MTVHNPNPVPEALQFDCLSDSVADLPPVDVSEDGVYRSYHLELRQYRGIANISSMEDLIDMLEYTIDLVAQEAVSIRYKTDHQPVAH